MKRQNRNHISHFLIISTLLIVLASGCGQPAESCPPFSDVDLSAATTFAANDDLPFQFPLDDDKIFTAARPFSAPFASYGMTTRGPEYHAAEDILQPAGTPVYAVADGKVSYSGPQKGYGWLIIIDHPQANLYSLYGHMSPSRWQIEPGIVEKGELIGYLGDADENGGSKENPMPPHLHLGLRLGERADYPSMGQWRWQAGWIKPCPQELGWLQPSLIIAGQNIPAGGFKEIGGSFITRWGFELLFAAIFLVSGLSMLVYSIKQNKPRPLFITGFLFLAAGWYFSSKGMVLGYGLFTMAVLFLLIGVYRFILRVNR